MLQKGGINQIKRASVSSSVVKQTVRKHLFLICFYHITKESNQISTRRNVGIKETS